MSKIINRIIAIVLLLSLACNGFFIWRHIQDNRQTRSASERLENELTDTTNLVTAASGTIKQVDTGLSNVSKQLNDSKSTASAITDSTGTSIERCGDIEETIGTLRGQIKDLEDCCDSGFVGVCGDDSNNGGKMTGGRQ